MIIFALDRGLYVKDNDLGIVVFIGLMLTIPSSPRKAPLKCSEMQKATET